MTNIAIDNDWSPEERREYERYSVDFSLCVVDLDSNTILGNLADISATGMKLVTDTPIPVEKTFRVRLDIALGDDHQESVRFETRSVWSRKDHNPGQYETGFSNTLSPRASESIQRLIDLLMSIE